MDNKDEGVIIIGGDLAPVNGDEYYFSEGKI